MMPNLNEDSDNASHILDDKNKDEILLQGTDLALRGDGHGGPLTSAQVDLIRQLHDEMKPWRTKLASLFDKDGFCDLETCRRFLVARQWDFNKACQQLTATLDYKLQQEQAHKQDPAKNHHPTEFWQSPACVDNPLALSMRLIGWDDNHHRPICYTCFSEAHDRWNAALNATHMELLMNATERVLRQRRADGLNRTAMSRQWIWVVDFTGFGWSDQNPHSGILTAKLLQHYPEMLSMGILLNAPLLFRTMYSCITPFLDERVQEKVLFVNTSPGSVQSIQSILQDKIGQRAAAWISRETVDNKEQQKNAQTNNNTNNGEPKRYWIPPTDPATQHDARGMSDYVRSPYYVKTPGDAYEERRLLQQEQQVKGEESTRKRTL